MIETLKRFKFQIIVLLIIVVSIPITLIQLSRQQETRSRATGGAAISLKLNPLTSSQQLGTQFDVVLAINTDPTNDVNSIDTIINYDSSILTLVSFTPASTFSTPMINDSQTIGTLHYVATNGPLNSPITGSAVSIGTLKFQGKAVGTGTVTFSNIKVTYRGGNGAYLPIDTANTQNGSYVITSGTATPTPTPTPTGTGGPTATPTPTPTPGAYTISGTVYIDDGAGGGIANDGIKQAGESGYSGTGLSISPATLDLIFQTNANASGDYSFVNVPARTSSVTLAIPSGYIISNGNTPPNTNPRSVTTPPGATGVNFGIISNVTPTPTGTGCVGARCRTAPPPPTTPAGNTAFALTIGLDGLGTTGDNGGVNGTRSDGSGSTKNPKRPTRNVAIQVCNTNTDCSKTNSNWVTTKTGTINYNAGSGKFTGNVDMGSLAGGSYNIYVKSDGYLRRQVLGFNLTAGINTLPPISLFVGDIDGDNAINMLDYNILISCSVFSTDNHGACTGTPPNSQNIILSDLDDNGVIDQLDYNLWIRELSVTNGD